MFFIELFNIRNIHRKTPLLVSLFDSEDYEIFNSTYFEEHLPGAASKNGFMKLGKTKNCSLDILTLVKNKLKTVNIF